MKKILLVLALASSLAFGAASTPGKDSNLVGENAVTATGDADGGNINLKGGTQANTGSPGNVVFVNAPWDDSMSSSIALKDTGANVPTLTQYGTSGIYLPDYADLDDMQVFSIQFNHGIKVGTDLSAHVHWFGSTAADTDVVRWQITFQVRNIGGVYGSTTSGSALPTDQALSHTIYVDQACAQAGEHQVAEFTDLTSTLLGFSPNISCIITGNIKRVANGTGNEYSGDVFLLAFDVHYQKDTLGSRKEYTK